MGPGEGTPPGYAGVPWVVAFLMKIGFQKQKAFINCKESQKRANRAQMSPKANYLRSSHAPPPAPHGVGGTYALLSSSRVPKRAQRKGARP
jgi:hypothetical protein